VSDADRASAYVEDATTWLANGSFSVATDVLLEEFARVRADERAECLRILEDFRACYVSKGVHTILHILGENIRIRGARQATGEARAETARALGLTTSSVADVLRGRTWRHVR
jgi:hypothetical protein